jgi:hypothetical protein
MIWRIVRKDLRLLWPLAAGVVALQVLNAVVALRLGIYGEPQSLMNTRPLLDLVIAASSALLVVVLVHQERLVGGVQDWLVRPFRRSDVLLAKLLFMSLVVVVPQAFLSFAVGLIQQRPIVDTIVATVEAAVIAFAGQLPIVMIAALAGTLLEAIVGVLVLAILTYPLFVTFSPFLVLTGSPVLFPWMQLVLRVVLALGAAAVILPLQYSERRTTLARGAFVAVLLLYGVSLFSPWSAVFAAQQIVSPDRSSANAVELSFDPTLGPYRVGRFFVPDGQVYLPLKVSGLPQGAILDTEHVDVTVIAANGAVLYSGTPQGVNMALGMDGTPTPHLRSLPASHGFAETHQAVFIPPDARLLIGDQPVRLRVTYSLTLLSPGKTISIPAVGARREIAGIGNCASAEQDAFLVTTGLWCYAYSSAPHCFVTTVRDRNTGLRNPETGFCGPDYDPNLIRPARLSGASGWAVTRYLFSLPFDQPDALLPITPDKMAEADLIVTPYVTQAWFTRTMETPAIRLRDYTARPEKSHTVSTTCRT